MHTNLDECEEELFQDVVETPNSPLRRDRPPSSYKKHQAKGFTFLEAAFIIKGVGTYSFDVVTDILACIKYFSTGDFWWAIMTTIFILVSSITVQAASFRWFVDDYTNTNKNTNSGTKKQVQGLCRRTLHWIVWIIVHALQLGTLNRYFRCLYFGWKSRQSRKHFDKYYIWKVFEQRDLTMLRLIEAFMEAGPQLVLQIYIMLQLYLESELPKFYWITALSALSSLLSLSWALEAYHKALRESLEDKQDITYCGAFCRLIWRVAMITSRVTAIALFTVHFKWIIFPVVSIHWIFMVAWLISQKTEFCDTKTEEILFCCVIAVVHIFCFFNMKEGRTRYRIAFYYTLIFIENSAMITLWYYYSGAYLIPTYGLVALSFVAGGFSVGIFAMLLYYVCFHPNRYHKIQKREIQTRTEATVEGVIFQDVPDGVRRKRYSNMFSKKGRRYIHRMHEMQQSISDVNQNISVQVNSNINGKSCLLYETSV